MFSYLFSKSFLIIDRLIILIINLFGFIITFIFIFLNLKISEYQIYSFFFNCALLKHFFTHPANNIKIKRET